MFGPTVSVMHTGIDGITRDLMGRFSENSQEIAKAGAAVKARVSHLDRMSVSVGIPAGSADDRQVAINAAFLKLTGNSKKVKRRRMRLVNAAEQDITNAELLYIFSKGSPMRGQPARPVLEPAIASDEGRASINPEMAAVIQSVLSGNKREAVRHLNRAGMAGRNVARRFFHAQNGWAPNAPSTIKAKGSDVAGIDSGEMRNAITFVVEEGG
ncbi:MAG TPA: hypothetical protein VHZ09_03710 [Acidobacteriaceae bacterium]|jgi:hypothetical protein|nr:hypothetical protein [Acidobacteriaceae bacterium]